MGHEKTPVLELIINEGYEKIPSQRIAECDIYKRGDQRILYDPKKDSIVSAYTMKKKERKNQ